jgi:hypothetical protein
MASTQNSTAHAWGLHYWNDDHRAPFSLLPHDYTQDPDPHQYRFPPRWDRFDHLPKDEPSTRPEPRVHDWWIDQPKSLHERGFSAARYNAERNKVLGTRQVKLAELGMGAAEDDEKEESGVVMESRGNMRNVEVREGKSLDLRKERLREALVG